DLGGSEKKMNLFDVKWWRFVGVFVKSFFLIWFWSVVETSVNLLVPRRFRYKRIAGERVLVTGSGFGIGRSLAMKFGLREGCEVICWDVDEEANRETVQGIREGGGRAWGYTVDVTKKQEVKRCAKEVLEEHGPVDILINNAGINSKDSVLDLSEEFIEKVFGVNILSHFWTVRAFLPSMLSRDKGHIVSVASMAGRIGCLHQTHYASTKHAAIGFMDALGMELRALGSRVKTTTVCPAAIRTSMVDYMFISGQTSSPLFQPLNPITPLESATDQMISGVKLEKKIVHIPKVTFIADVLKCLLTDSSYLVLHDLIGIDEEFRKPEEHQGSNRLDEKNLSEGMCSSDCGPGMESRTVMCSGPHPSMCDASTKPSSTRSCYSHAACPPASAQGTWFAGPWSECSVTCGGGGVRSRDLICVAFMGSQQRVVASESCDLEAKPDTMETCSRGPCPQGTWLTGPWSQCSSTCGPGAVRSRQVMCVDTDKAECASTDSCALEARPSALEPCEGLPPCGHEKEIRARRRHEVRHRQEIRRTEERKEERRQEERRVEEERLLEERRQEEERLVEERREEEKRLVEERRTEEGRLVEVNHQEERRVEAQDEREQRVEQHRTEQHHKEKIRHEERYTVHRQAQSHSYETLAHSAPEISFVRLGAGKQGPAAVLELEDWNLQSDQSLPTVHSNKKEPPPIRREPEPKPQNKKDVESSPALSTLSSNSTALKSPKDVCLDELFVCSLAIRGRLCAYKYYQQRCCQSCTNFSST
ncbi:unnamed protein product, partial [Cyprideis torosa]